MIDFYFDEGKAQSMDAFSVDARPALDSVGSLHDRVKMGVREAETPARLPRVDACVRCGPLLRSI